MSRNRANKVSQRAQRGGGREVALSPAAVALAQGQNQGLMGASDEWFGPGRPLQGMAPPSVAGRRFDYSFGTNVNITPRQTERHSFASLRALADGHDLTRLAIETRKDQMSRLKFTFSVVDSEDDLTAEQDARAKKYRQLLRRPDGVLFWADWLRSVIEDLLVIDAPSIFVRRTVDQTQIVGLCQIDGATIKPVVDAGGRTPSPPETAYQQVLHGMPAVNYTTAQLVYRPRNIRVHSVYGFSPVEQIIATINIALRRQLWQHSYFTDGNLPDSLIGVPSTWTPDQIRAFQDWFDALLTGNAQRRRGGVFVPGEVAKSYVPTKDAEMFGTAEEWLARVVCFAFGISHQALVKEVNRATAGTAQEQALEDGLAPIMGWVKSLIDGILMDQFGESELEFSWVDDKEMDPVAQDQLWAGRVDRGVASRNDWRAAVGMDPDPTPEAGMLMATTALAPTPISVDGQIAQQKTRSASGVFPTPPSSGDVVASEGEDGGEDDENSPPSTTAKAAGGQPDGHRPFVKEGAGETPSEIGEPDEEHQTLTDEERTTFRRLSPERPLVERARKRLQRTLERALSRQGTRVAAAVRKYLEHMSSDATKADEPEVGATVSSLALGQHEAEIISVALDGLGSWDFVIDGVSQTLETVATDAVRQSVAVIGTPDLFEQVSARSVAAAEDRAAELVGRRVLADGSIIDNPDARWAISRSTRTMIHDRIVEVISQNEGSDALIRSLEDDHAFSPARAEMISRTEIADINSQAQMNTYHAAQEAGVSVRKRWLLGPRPCQICRDNAAEGPIALEQTFKSGNDSSPAHPHCVCAVIPEVD